MAIMRMLAIGALLSGLALLGGVPPAVGVAAVGPPAGVLVSSAPFPDSLLARSQENLRRHVDAQRLGAWRDTCDAEARAAFDFLFAWLPPSDLAAWRAAAVEEDIRLAVRTRREAPWRDEVDDFLFLRYVLPHRVAQEPIQPWRRELHDLLQPRVQGMNLREAVLETNRFCREHATFMPTSSRDQGPLTTMARGLARCEEEMIFFVSAARSVGIPARPCYTPAWMANDNNHAWVEAWTGDGWHYLGACEPAPDVDQAWFSEPARRAGLVLSVAYGEGAFPGEEIYAQRDGATLINSTAVYTTPGSVAVTWADRAATGAARAKSRRSTTAAGSPAARDTINVHVHVFNWGALAELATFPAGRTLTLGPGDYVITADVDGHALAAPVTIRPGQRSTVRLDPRANERMRLGWLESPFWLHIPVPPARASVASDAGAGISPLVQRTHELAIARNDLDRARRSKPASDLIARIATGWFATRKDSPGTDSLGPFLARLDDAGIEAPAWAAFLAGFSSESLEAESVRVDTLRVAQDLLDQMDDKDFFECDTASARVAVDEAIRARSLRARWGQTLPDSLWTRYVLSPRIDQQPGDFALWRELPLWTSADSSGARRIHALFSKRVRQAPPSRLGHVATPGEVWACGMATRPAARAALVGLLRRNGIAGRVDSERRWVEAWVDGGWIPMDPFDDGSGNQRAGEVAEAFAPPAHLDLRLLELGAAMARAEGWLNFRLVRFREGHFDPMQVDYPVADGRVQMEIEPGEYWFFGGQRNHVGDPRIVARRFVAASGGTVAMRIDLGIPAAERDREDLAPRQMPEEGWTRIRSVLPLRPRPTLAYFWKPADEPSLRTAGALRAGWTELTRLGLDLVSVAIAPGSAPDAVPIPPPSGLKPAATMTIPASSLAATFGAEDDSRLPLIVLVNEAGKTVLWLEGMQLAPVDLVRQALRGR